MNIVRAQLADLPDLAELFDAYRVFYEQASDVARAESFLRARIEQADAVIFLLRDAAGLALGFTQLYPCFSSVSTAPIWVLNDLYVSSEARGLGVGAGLLRHARDFAVATGALRIELSTAHTNSPAQRLYEREGYVQDHEFRRYSISTAR